MPTAEEQRESARVSVIRYGQTATEPTLDSDDVESILNDAKRGTIWAVATAYVYGDVILPTVRNGHSYRCIVAGTSEALTADEPNWPTLQGEQITEGASDPLLTWQEDGPDFVNLYNVRSAIHAAWMLKAGKAAGCVTVNIDGQMIAESDVIKHCLQMAEKFNPVEFA